MWADNSYWLPQVRILGQRWPAFDTFFPVQAIGGNRVRGYFLYSGLSQIRDNHVEFLWPGSAIGIFSRLFWTNHDVSDGRGEMAVIGCSLKKFFWGIFWHWILGDIRDGSAHEEAGWPGLPFPPRHPLLLWVLCLLPGAVAVLLPHLLDHLHEGDGLGRHSLARLKERPLVWQTT